MNKKNKKQVLLAFLIVFILFMISLVVAFFYYRNQDKKNNDNLLKVKFKSSDVITIENRLPMSDEFGKNLDGTGTEEGVQGYVEFSIKNENSKDVDYIVYLTKQDVSITELRGDYIKFYFTDIADNPMTGFEKNMLPSFNDLTSLVDMPEGRLVYNGSLESGEEKSFKLRAWLSDTYTISDTEEGFSVDVNVKVS